MPVPVPGVPKLGARAVAEFPTAEVVPKVEAADRALGAAPTAGVPGVGDVLDVEDVPVEYAVPNGDVPDGDVPVEYAVPGGGSDTVPGERLEFRKFAARPSYLYVN